MGKSYRRSGNFDIAHDSCGTSSKQGKDKIREFNKSFRSLSDVENADDDEILEKFFESD